MTLAGGLTVCSRSVVEASGAQYRKLAVENYEKYENRGINYAATAMESVLCRDKEVIVIGGGNSAGQASVFCRASQDTSLTSLGVKRWRAPCHSTLSRASRARLV